MSKDLTNSVFGNLKAIRIIERKNYHNKWLCQCTCGKEKVVWDYNLLNGHTTSCGCAWKKSIRKPNKYEFMGSVCKCILKNGDYFVFDSEDYEKVKDYTWHKLSSGYVYNGLDKIRFHRLVMNCPEGLFVDHINHDKADNRKENLRICTNEQNCHNRKAKGVYWQKGKWFATIGLKGKSVYLGRFDNYEKAVKARKEAELKYYGEFANGIMDKRKETLMNMETRAEID